MSQEEAVSIGRRLKDAREAAQVGVCELSERGKIGRQEIYNVERGHEIPSAKMIEAYVNVCALKGLVADNLFLDADKVPPDVFKFLKARPEWCDVLRMELSAEGG